MAQIDQSVVVPTSRRWLWLALRAGLLAQFEPAKTSPLAAIARTDAQILLIHGLSDDHIPPEHSRRLHAAAAKHSELILVQGDDHFSINSDRSGAIGTKGVAWLRRWLAPPETAR